MNRRVEMLVSIALTLSLVAIGLFLFMHLLSVDGSRYMAFGAFYLLLLATFMLVYSGRKRG